MYVKYLKLSWINSILNTLSRGEDFTLENLLKYNTQKLLKKFIYLPIFLYRVLKSVWLFSTWLEYPLLKGQGWGCETYTGL